MKIIKAPKSIKEHGSFLSVFLAGSIEMGQAEDWQSRVEREMGDFADDVLSIFNPRRDDFQTDQKQSIDNPYFKEQVMWELDGLNQATHIFMYLHPDTKAPITMLELGLFAEWQSIIVVCPDGFWRKGNIEIICDVYDIPLISTLEEGIEELQKVINANVEFAKTHGTYGSSDE